MNIKEVRDGVIILPKGQYRIVLEVSSINFKLKSDSEQDALIDTFAGYLNSLPTSIQIIVRVRELDISDYLESIEEMKKAEPEETYKEQLQSYAKFVQDLVVNNKILSRRFYIVVPLADYSNDFNSVKEQLTVNADIVGSGLMNLGIQARQLDSLEVLDLFYDLYNPQLSKQQPISKKMMQALDVSYMRGAKNE